MTDLFARLSTLSRALVTWLVFASVVLTSALEALPDDAPGDVALWLGRLVAWLATAILIVRRVSPVSPAERGLISE